MPRFDWNMRVTNYKLLKHQFWLFSIAILLSFGVLARTPVGITTQEMAMLPKYCPYTQGFKLSSTYDKPSPAVRRWVSIMGDDFWHMHHHCWALIHFARAHRVGTSRSSKRASLTEARDDFLYVALNGKSEFVLMPEVLTWLGRTTNQLGNTKEAVQAFQRAIELKTNYWPAYFHWASMSLARGSNKAEVLGIVREGLRHSPDSKSLIALYLDLGGKAADIPAPSPPIPKDDGIKNSDTDSAAN